MFLKQNLGKNRPFFVYFISFFNTMTNIVQNLTIGGKGVDGVLWINFPFHFLPKALPIPGQFFTLSLAHTKAIFPYQNIPIWRCFKAKPLKIYFIIFVLKRQRILSKQCFRLDWHIILDINVQKYYQNGLIYLQIKISLNGK